MPAHCAWAPGHVEGKQVFVMWVSPNFWESRLMLEMLWAPLLPDSHLFCALASPASARSTCVVRDCGTSQLGRSLFPNEGVSSCTSRMASSTWSLYWLEGEGRTDGGMGWSRRDVRPPAAMLGTGWASVSRVIFED